MTIQRRLYIQMTGRGIRPSIRGCWNNIGGVRVPAVVPKWIAEVLNATSDWKLP
jgi:hypothetical protein